MEMATRRNPARWVTVPPGAQDDAVEVRVLGGPGAHDPDGQLHPVGAVHGGGKAELRDLHLHRERVRGGRDPAAQDALTGGRVPVRGEVDVVDPAVHLAEHANVAEDPREPPLVLVLEVGPRAELVDPHHHGVLPVPNEVGDVELVGEPGAHRLAGPPSVHPHPEGRLDALEAQQHGTQVRPRAAGEIGEHEARAVVARRIGVRDVRRVHGEGVDDVGVPGGAEPPVPVEVLEHPVAGDGDPVRPGGVRCCRVGAGRDGVGRRGEPAEVPRARQRELRPVGGEVRPRGQRPAGSVGVGEPPRVHSGIAVLPVVQGCMGLGAPGRGSSWSGRAPHREERSRSGSGQESSVSSVSKRKLMASFVSARTDAGTRFA